MTPAAPYAPPAPRATTQPAPVRFFGEGLEAAPAAGPVGLDIDAGSYGVLLLQRIASAASSSGSTVRLRNVGHLTSRELRTIRSAGHGHVVFSFDADARS